ncbi:cytochrome P450 [Saccharopolyspora sp. HNM0983]|uniref:Cytochrome P450 n=2 Tax=Saccharopolyspora montiporae TaxID=2781240 RepID=A0A929BB02_9PSEU|nr:cytochrome P450 [Saccharopolyspora sp. HNM0983]MBE9376549.1 cytochrome P450 [Saccharopolyspora sp. HNM0983]
MYEQLRERDPVHHVERGDYWVLSRYADVAAAAKDPSTFSSARGLTVESDELRRAGLGDATPMVFLDPPEHTDFRALINRGFTPRRIDSIEPQVREFVVRRLERLAGRGEVDLVAELLKPLPSFVVAHYLGVPEADRVQFDRWTDDIVAAAAGGDPLATPDAVAGLFDYFQRLVEWKRADPGDDVISDLIGVFGDDDPLGPIRILGFAFTMVAGGNDTTTGLLSAGAELLTAHPEQRDALAADPRLIPEAVEELLRLTSPVQGLARTTTRDVQLGDRTIPAGRKVLLLYAAANRDPRRYGPDAERLDITRAPRNVLAFSVGAHHCLGAHAARLQARVVLEELLARYPGFAVHAARGEFATGHYVRRYRSLPCTLAPAP